MYQWTISHRLEAADERETDQINQHVRTGKRVRNGRETQTESMVRPRGSPEAHEPKISGLKCRLEVSAFFSRKYDLGLITSLIVSMSKVQAYIVAEVESLKNGV